ncbi:dipeptidyl-peptidase-4 [Micromonospora sagamiensis]|uniref:Dipeptidyl-peptidase-4 n=1 Tax=Micromonospora sagamiensis TaxID=47875 RepID=A0A562WAH5_9ACTN|nr:dipeptidyl-peptidase-4 [Micromonospora sagamiensis]
MDYPELAARTRRFSHGAPRAVTVADDGSRVVFLRSGGPQDPTDALWLLDVTSGAERLVAEPTALLGGDGAAGDLPATERALRERLRLSAGGIGSYATDPAARVAVFTLAGRLFRADLVHGDVVEVATAGPAIDPRPDPTGQRLAYVTDAGATTRRGELRVIEPDGSDTMLAGEDSRVTWGLAEHIAAEEFDRFRGYWWAPDGRSILAARVDESRLTRWHLHDPADPASPPVSVAYPVAGGPNAEVSLHLLDLDGGWVDVHWDRETYPYLVAVDWVDGGPLITVLRRSQQHGLVLAVDPRTGETQVHAELADPRWVDPIPGTPAHLPDGRVLVGGELAHDGYDARCLFADGTLLTPPSLYVRRVVGRLTAGSGPADLLVEASDGEPSQRHLFRVRTVIGGGVDARRLTQDEGWHTAVVGGDVLVVGYASLDHPGVRWTVRRGDEEVATLRSHAATPPWAPRPALERVTDRQLPAAVVYPGNHVAGRRLPVLLDVYGGPGHQEVVAARGPGWNGSGGRTRASRWSPSTTGVRRVSRPRSRR